MLNLICCIPLFITNFLIYMNLLLCYQLNYSNSLSCHETHQWWTERRWIIIFIGIPFNLYLLNSKKKKEMLEQMKCISGVNFFYFRKSILISTAFFHNINFPRQLFLRVFVCFFFEFNNNDGIQSSEMHKFSVNSR